jgi:hypothetical protein
MRVLMKVTIPVEAGNEAISNGTLGSTIQSILAEQKPEAAYFFAQGGKRGGIVVLDLKDTAQIPAIAEPWFLAFNAEVEFHPVMNVDDLARALPAIEHTAKRYAVKTKATAAG